MKKTYLFLIYMFIYISINAQDSTLNVYGELPVYKIIQGGYISVTNVNNQTSYSINNTKVSESDYNRELNNAKLCTPCIAILYNKDNLKIYEGIKYTDCGVGWFKRFYPNGKIKLIGSYKENPTGDWNNIWDRGYCNVPNGQWTYFNKKGDTLYSELWQNGQFIKQTPEQNNVEIWDVELLLNIHNVENKLIEIDSINHLIIVPKYKNSHTNSELIIKFEVSAIGYPMNKKTFSLESFKTMDIYKMLKEVRIPKKADINFALTVFSNGKFIKRFYLNIKK